MKNRKFVSWQVRLVVGLLVVKAIVGVYAFGDVQAASRWVTDELKVVGTWTRFTAPDPDMNASQNDDLVAAPSAGSVSMTGLGTTYSENFDTLSSSATPASTPMPNGWDFTETGTNANTTYVGDTGASNSGNTFSYGASGASDRALGMLRSSSLISTLFASYTNNTGKTVAAVTISYTGEQWRLGATGRQDRLDFSYSSDATSKSTGTYTAESNLTFTAPQGSASPVPTAGALNGNAAANRTTITYTITGLTIADGSALWMKWADPDVTSSDDGLAVDDFSITAYSVPDTTIATSPGASSGASADFTFTSDNGGATTFECSLDGGAYAACTASYTLTGLTDGEHTLNVRAVNPAGTDATPASHTWTVSTGSGTPTPSPTATPTPVPDTTIGTKPSSTTASTSATFEFTSDIGGATFECKLDSGSYESCSSPKEYTSLSDGSHTFNVRATADGQTDASPATYTWTVDTTAPETSITSGPPGATYKTSASLSFSATDAGGVGVASYECKLDEESFAACSSPKSYSGLASGSHTFSVRAIDSLGNVDATPSTVTWTIGTGAFTGGNLAAIVVASSSASNTTADIVELSKTAASQFGVQAIEIPGSGSTPLRFSGSSTANAYLSRSNDGSLLLFTGHNSTDTTTAVTGIAARGVGAFTAGALFSIPATYTNASSAQTRGAGTSDNVNFYFADASGLFTNGTSTASPTGSYRGAKSFGGVVYLGQSSASAAPVGTVSALTGGTFTALPGLPNGAANDFHFVSSGENGPIWDVLYVVSASSATAGSIAKYSLVGGTWTANGSYATTFGGFGMAAEDFGTGARLYVSTGSGATSGNSVIRVTDTAGYNAAMAVTTADNVTLYTAASGTSIKGVTFAPQSGLNSAPVITAAAGVTRQQASASSNSTIATVGDLDTGAGSPTVTVTSSNPSNGVTISNIVNTNGTITADIVAACDASEATFTLQASDGTATSTASFTVSVTSNTAPVLAYGNSSAALTGSASISPTSGPSDNGSISSIAIQSQGTFTGTISVDSAGVISVSDAGPAGSHNITVRATDNCGATTDASFTLLVSSTTPPDTTITSQPPSPYNSTSATFEFTSDRAEATFECRLNSGSYSVCISPKSVTATANASNTFYVRAKDTDGVYDPTPASYTWTVDTTAPDVTISSAPASTTVSTTATFGFISTDGTAVFQCSMDSAPYASCTSPKSYTGLANGSHTFSVRSVDGAGNMSNPSNSTFIVAKPSAFGSSNLVVFRAGGVASNTTGTLVELDRTTAAQTPVQSISLDGSGSLSLRFSGSATSTGYLVRSSDGSKLLFTGHNSTNTSSNANTLLTRGVGVFTPAGDFSLPTTYTGASGNQTRSATTVNGSTYFITDTGGLYTNGASLADPAGNFRAAKAFGGTVYVGSTNTSLAPVVTVASATGATAASLPGLPNASGSEADFYLISSGDNGGIYDVLYYISASGATSGTIYKYSLVGTSWVSNGTYTTNFGGFSLAAEDSGAGATLYITTGSGATAVNNLIRVTDAGGYNQTIAVTTADNVTLYTAPTGTTLKGVAFTPADWVNSSPTFVAASVSKPKGGSASNATIATVGDLDTGAGSVTVTLTSPDTSNGVTISNIQKAGNSVTADIATSCSATDASFTFEVGDGTATATGTLNVTVTADTGPTLTYSNATVLEGASTTINPATGPSDNGSVASVSIQSQGTYTGTISVDSAGVVSISNAGPGGQHTITVRATDACGTYTDATFTLTVTDVTAPNTTITGNPDSLSNSTTASFSFGSSESNSTFECSVDGGTYAACTSPQEVTGLTEGSHTFAVRATDAASNTDATPASYSWTVDLTSPTLTPGAPLGNTSSTADRVWTVTATDANGIGGVSMVYQVGGTPPPPSTGEGVESSFGPPATVTCSAGTGANEFDCTIPGQPNGAVVTYYAIAADAAGNTALAPSPNAPHVYAVGSATIPSGTYGYLQLDAGITLSGSVTVTETLNINGIVSTGGNTIVLGPNASISGAGPNSYIVGTVTQLISGTGLFSIPIGDAPPTAGFGPGTDPAGSYTPVDVNVTAIGEASSLTFSTTPSVLTGANPVSSLARYWDVVEAGDVTVDITFHYLDGDVAGNESSYMILRRAGITTATYGGVLSTTANTFTASDVSEFSSWSAGALIPTAAGADIEGRVLGSNGSALRNVSVLISGGNLREAVTVKTNQFGVYRFEGLETGATYVIQVISGRHRFRNPSKVINLYESVSNEDFVAEPPGSRQ